MEEKSRSLSLRFDRSGSLLRRITGRSKSSRLLMDSVSLAVLPSYERLSRSLRSPAEPDLRERQKARGVWKLLNSVFSSKVGEVVDATSQERKKKEKKKEERNRSKRSSWLPDPNRRWPVQGW